MPKRKVPNVRCKGLRWIVSQVSPSLVCMTTRMQQQHMTSVSLALTHHPLSHSHFSLVLSPTHSLALSRACALSPAHSLTKICNPDKFSCSTAASSTCRLCDGKALLYTAPQRCAACRGRGRRREPGHFFETECRVCDGLAYTLEALQPCQVCSKKSWWALRSGPPCQVCHDSRWVAGRQAECILCKVLSFPSPYVRI